MRKLAALALLLTAAIACNHRRAQSPAIKNEQLASEAAARLLTAFNAGCERLEARWSAHSVGTQWMTECLRLQRLLGPWRTLSIEESPDAGPGVVLKGKAIFANGAFRFLALWNAGTSDLDYLFLGEPGDGVDGFPLILPPARDSMRPMRPRLVDPPPKGRPAAS